MIKTWSHKGLKLFFDTGSVAQIQAKHAKRLKILLAVLHAATKPEDMNLPGFDYHKLTGNKKNHYAVSVNGNWRLVFKFEEGNAILVNYLDYH